MAGHITQNNVVFIQGEDLQPSDFPNVGYFYHQRGTNSLYVGEFTDQGTFRWVNVTGPNVVAQNINFYVDSVNGRDGHGDGTIDSPFKTLSWALRRTPKSPDGICLIHLIGAGPYTLPSTLNAVTPVGLSGQPLLICGAAMQPVYTGTIGSMPTIAQIVPTGSPLITDQYRGYFYRGVTGTSAGKTSQIAENTTTTLYSIHDNFGASVGDTFEILQPVTQVVCPDSVSQFTLVGPGSIGFWQCAITARNFNIVSNVSVLFDSCFLFPTNGGLTALTGSTLQMMATWAAPDFRIITTAGTQVGNSGVSVSCSPAERVLTMSEGSYGIGYLVSNGGIDTGQAGRWNLLGSDIDLTSATNTSAMIARGQGVLQLSGLQRIKAGGAGSLGVLAKENSYVQIMNDPRSVVMTVTGAGIAALAIEDAAIVELHHFIGDTNGYGVMIQDGGTLINNNSNTVTGTSGDVLIQPNTTATAWADITHYTFGPSSGSSTAGLAEAWVDSSTGSDSNSGSQSSPFQTLIHALSAMETTPSGQCRIHLIGTGPYTLPSTLNGVYPTGPNGEPLLICGDSMAVAASGTVASVSGASLTPVGGGLTTNAYRGMIYKGITGASAVHYYHIANNSTTQLFSIGNTFSAAPGDTFEILQPRTQLQLSGTLSIEGGGKLGFWRCGISVGALDIADQSAVLFDACTIVSAGKITAYLKSVVQFLATVESADFKIITTAGTQFGKVGLFVNNPAVDPVDSIRMFSGSFGRGYLVTKGGIDTWAGGQWYLLGTDIDLTGGVNSSGIISQAGGYLEMDQGYHHLVLGGANGIGIAVEQGATARLTAATINITQAGDSAIFVSGGGVLHMDGVTGSTGNGYGVRVEPGGMLINNGGNTVTGTNGDVLVNPNSSTIPWANVGTFLLSNPARPGLARHPVADTNYTAAVTDQLIAYTSLTAPRTVTLPDPATMNASPAFVRRVKVQDEAGTAGSSTITVASAGGAAVHGTATITANYGRVSLYTQGTAWFVD